MGLYFRHSFIVRLCVYFAIDVGVIKNVLKPDNSSLDLRSNDL